MRAASIAATLAAAALATAQDAPHPVSAAPRPAGTVTFLDGEATRRADGSTRPLAVGGAVYLGDLVETGSRTRLELELPDQSHLRLGPLSRLSVRRAHFGKEPGDRDVAAALYVGSVWSTVTRAVGSGSRFEIQTANAVAGVRGTTFRVDASQDQSVVVKVYAGAVAVASGLVFHQHTGGEEAPAAAASPAPAEPSAPTSTPPPAELPAPAAAAGAPAPSALPAPGTAGPEGERIRAARWERLVTELQELRVSAHGRPERTLRFAPRPDHDPFERWNRDRDERLRERREAHERARPPAPREKGSQTPAREQLR